MPFDPENQRDVSRLVTAARKSRLKLGFHRELRNKFQREYLGKNYSDKGATQSVAPNDVEQFVAVHKQLLAPSVPAAFVTVRDQALLGTRSKLELGLNHLANEIDLETTFDLVVFDALLLMAVVKVGLTEKTFRYQGYRHDTGQPFVDHILQDDWVHDYGAKSWETVEYAGDQSFEPLELLKDTYPKHADSLSRVEYTNTNEDGDTRGDPVDRTLDGQERVTDYGSVWQLWLPQPNLIMVMAGDARGIRPLVLEWMEWQGPENGPYHMLGFETVPGSTIPLSPIATVFELAKLGGALFRKSSRQAENQKTVIAARRSAAADARKLISADDMEVVTADDPTLIKDFRLNGADPQTLQMGALVRQLFSQYSGNLNLTGGLAAQSDTLGQDELLVAASSQRIKRMQKKVKKFTKGVFRDLAFWLFTDPRIELPLVKPNPGAAQGIRMTLTPEDMEGDFLDYNIDVNPYSMQARTPQEELEVLAMTFERFVLPYREDYQRQGMTINWPKLLRRVAELTNQKTIDEFLMFTGVAAPPKQSVGSPPQTVRSSGAGAGGQGGNGRQFQQAGGDVASMMSMISGQGSRQRETIGV
jgi:hypothetical protein